MWATFWQPLALLRPQIWSALPLGDTTEKLQVQALAMLPTIGPTQEDGVPRHRRVGGLPEITDETTKPDSVERRSSVAGACACCVIPPATR
jgi:hypothetical protein